MYIDLKLQPTLAYKSIPIHRTDHMHITTIVFSCLSYETMSVSWLIIKHSEQ